MRFGRLETGEWRLIICLLAPGKQAVEGEAGENAAGGDGRGKITFTCAPFACRDAVDHRYHKPDGVE